VGTGSAPIHLWSAWAGTGVRGVPCGDPFGTPNMHAARERAPERGLRGATWRCSVSGRRCLLREEAG
jgi:hypothetical protein